jgi:molybdate transport system substrate-binding protein
VLLRLTLIAVLAGMAIAAPRNAPVLVSAAISLTDALVEIEKAYTAGGGGPVRFNFAASNVLARQIANGAPADLFISADLVQMRYVERTGAIEPGSVRHLLGNALAVVTPLGRPPITTARALADRSIRRLAIGDPAAVPAGFYAKQYLERLGLWRQLQRRLLPLSNVRAALAAVENGGADAAIVYESDAAASTKVALAFVVPRGDSPEIIYPMALVARSKNKAAAAPFATFLQGPQAAAIFKRYKFSHEGSEGRHRSEGPRTLGLSNPRTLGPSR